jgi:hypothetical protein
MVKVARRRFEIVYDPGVKDHLKAIDRKYHTLIRRTIEEQLTYEPQTESRNRKPLLSETEIDADWELRFGPDNGFRVFYTLDAEAGYTSAERRSRYENRFRR